jgi:hypothetical protein
MRGFKSQGLQERVNPDALVSEVAAKHGGRGGVSHRWRGYDRVRSHRPARWRSRLAATSATTFPGDNGRIAYSVWDSAGYDLYTINADASRRRQLTDTTVDELRPAWSPNGSRIAYQVYGKADSDIFTVIADGSGRRRLTNNDVDDFSSYDAPTTRATRSGRT